MTANDAKKDVAARLGKAGVSFRKLSAKTWQFSDLARGGVVRVTAHGVVGPVPSGIFTDVPKPSSGGYLVCMVMSGNCL